MALEPKPPTRPVWGEVGDITPPSDPKKSLGWVSEIPPFEWFNWILNNLAKFAAHVNESGIPVWDNQTVYDITALTKGANGIVYESLSNGNAGNDPRFDNVNWKVAFVSNFSGTNKVSVDSFIADDLPHLKLLLDNGKGPYNIKGKKYTKKKLIKIYNTILSAWMEELEN